MGKQKVLFILRFHVTSVSEEGEVGVVEEPSRPECVGHYETPYVGSS